MVSAFVVALFLFYFGRFIELFDVPVDEAGHDHEQDVERDPAVVQRLELPRSVASHSRRLSVTWVTNRTLSNMCVAESTRLSSSQCTFFDWDNERMGLVEWTL